MNKIKETFGRARVVLPVVHCCNEAQARVNANMARICGADGVWLINQGGMRARPVLNLAGELVAESPGFFVGVNTMGTRPLDTARLLAGRVKPQGLWTDNAGLDDGAFAAFHTQLGWRPLYFGGVAFKYQAPVAPELYGQVAAEAAHAGVDVVTTSGPGTGEPTPVEKVAAMREAIGTHALAVASGVSIENVDGLLPYVDAFIVSSSIESSFGHLDTIKLRALVERVHAWGQHA